MNNVLCDGTEKEKFIVQQFTGLLDSEGTEIYEGDIVDCQVLSHSRGFKTKTVRCKVIFSSGMFMPKPIDGYNFGVSFDNCKVIGNIYQNPELL